MQTHAAQPVVDLVVIIDTSMSMRSKALALSTAAEDAIAAAASRCPADLRVVWLGIEGTWKATRFNLSVRNYLTQHCQTPVAVLRGRRRSQVKDGGAQEDGARAIEDIARHFDWRPQARRAVFFLGDEGLEGGGEQVTAADSAAADQAIEQAQAAGVTVHTYYAASSNKFSDAVQREYARLTETTGGQAFNDQTSISGFADVLQQIICATRNREVTAEVTDEVAAEVTDEVAAEVADEIAAEPMSTRNPSPPDVCPLRSAVALPAHGPVGTLPLVLANPITGPGLVYVHEYDPQQPDRECVLHLLDVSSGATLPVGSIGQHYVADLACADGALYGIKWSADAQHSELFRIDPATGRSTLIGTTGHLLYGLTYAHARATLYATGANRQLFIIDPHSGQATPTADFTRIPSEIAVHHNGQVYVTFVSDGMKTLAIVDPDSGAVRDLGECDLAIWSMDFVGNTLYAVTRTGRLLHIDTTSGTTTTVAETGRHWAGMSVYPAALMSGRIVYLPCLLLSATPD